MYYIHIHTYMYYGIHTMVYTYHAYSMHAYIYNANDTLILNCLFVACFIETRNLFKQFLYTDRPPLGRVTPIGVKGARKGEHSGWSMTTLDGHYMTTLDGH